MNKETNSLKKYIATVKDYPKKGILFRDITPLMANGQAFKKACDKMIEFAREKRIDSVVSPEARGFIFGCPVAANLGVGFIPIRKPNKLPRETVSYKYSLEYGENELHMHKDGIFKGQRVLIVDDLLATGGTVEATIKMVESLGGIVVGCSFLIELQDLKGREKIKNKEIQSLIQY